MTTVHAFSAISLCLACIARELIQRVSQHTNKSTANRHQYYLLCYYSCMQQARRLRMIMATCYLTLCQTAICCSLSLSLSLSLSVLGAFHNTKRSVPSTSLKKCEINSCRNSLCIIYEK
jgi:hypothetical protein